MSRPRKPGRMCIGIKIGSVCHTENALYDRSRSLACPRTPPQKLPRPYTLGDPLKRMSSLPIKVVGSSFALYLIQPTRLSERALCVWDFRKNLRGYLEWLIVYPCWSRKVSCVRRPSGLAYVYFRELHLNLSPCVRFDLVFRPY